jgi:hypothetical protein
MISIAWIISLLLCAPQAFIFKGDDCKSDFVPNWGAKAYVIWFSVSNFFIPFVILLFCYTRICYVIWDNFNSKLESSEDTTFVDKMKTCLTCLSTKRKRPGFKYRWKTTRNAMVSVTRRGSNDSIVEEDNRTETTDNPDAINAINSLRRASETPSDSSIDSEDQKRFNVSHCCFLTVSLILL